MGASIKVTKVDYNNFNVAFSQEMTGPAGVTAGGEVPIEWLRAVLDYYVTHRDDTGAVPQAKIDHIRGYW